jgi:tripartite-type tricarboxylate transporter receptor subunit TctC
MVLRRRMNAMTLPRLLFLAGALTCGAVSAQSSSTAPIRLVVASPPGSTQDLVARAIAPRLGEALGQPVTIDNRIATNDGAVADLVAKAPPDGHTLLLATPAFAALTALYSKLPFDGVKAFAPVGRIATEPMLLVATSTMPMSSLQELLALARANPGRINYASTGGGSTSHLAGELLKSVATVQLAHAPAKTVEAGLAEVVAGRVKLMFLGVAPAEAAVRSGKVKALAVTGPARLARFPDIPTMREVGVLDYDFNGWFGVLAPAGTPKVMVDRINADLRKAVQAPDVRDKLAVLLGAEPRVSTPEEFTAQLAREVVVFGKLAREMNLKVE